MAIEDIIREFGGLRGMAAKLGHRNHTTVQGWLERGIIPAQRQREILEAAHANGITLVADDLIPPATTHPDTSKARAA